MPFEVVWEPKGAYKRVWGDVSAQEFMQSIAAIQNDPRHDTLKYTVNDFLGVNSLQISESDVHLFAAAGIGASFSNGNVLIAIVATHPQIIALVNEYTKLAPYSVKFFDTLEAAYESIPAKHRP